MNISQENVRKTILIASDKFKDSLSATEICELMKIELQSANKNLQIDCCPLADGGDGSLEVISTYLDFKNRECKTLDPLGRGIEACYLISNDTAYIELASASGLAMLNNAERNPMSTSSLGTGLMLMDALAQGIKHICLFLGGSSTNDGGLGIAEAFGYKFFDIEGKRLKPVGASLRHLNNIVAPETPVLIESLKLYCDVKNVPFGPKGAAHVYAGQKGANSEEIKLLDEGLENLCAVIFNYNGVDLSHLEGGGAAGGTAVGLVGLLGAELISGMDYMVQLTSLEEKIAKADLVISGEGKLDMSTFDGKVVSVVAKLCKKYGKKLCLVVGTNELDLQAIDKLEVEKVYSLIERSENLEDAMLNVTRYMKLIGQELGDTYG